MVLEAVVQLAKEFVEQVSGGGGMPIATVTPLAVVLAC